MDRGVYYLPNEHYLQVSQGAGKKVAPDGVLLPFYGNTVIFDLDSDTKSFLKDLQESLYEACGHFLSEKLLESSFHVTLHDLLSGTDHEKMKIKVEGLADFSRKKVEDVKKVLCSPIPMKPVKLVSMVSTSVVVLLEPVYPVHKQLLELAYSKLQDVVKLDYGLTPHVTLAYYRPGIIVGDDLEKLANTLEMLTEQLHGVICLKPELLFYSEFTDMNHYIDHID